MEPLALCADEVARRCFLPRFHRYPKPSASSAYLFGLMPLALQIWFYDGPWWLLALIVLGGGFLLYQAFMFATDWWMFRDPSGDDPSESREGEIVYPYYVEHSSLRDLAHTVKLELPTSRSVTKSRKISVGTKGTSGERGGSETQEYGEQIPLRKLAEAVEESWNYEGHSPATDLAVAASVSDERALSSAIEQIQHDFPGTSQTAELLSRVKEAFNGERIEALAAKKRKEFETVGKDNPVMVFAGQFAFKEDGPAGSGPILKLTHFNPTPGYMSPDSAGENGEIEADLIPIPDGVGLNIVLPDETALTPAGKERIRRNKPFYAGVIAHSASYNQEAGILTCSAWAIWGERTPDWRERVHPRYSGPGAGYPYGC